MAHHSKEEKLLDQVDPMALLALLFHLAWTACLIVIRERGIPPQSCGRYIRWDSLVCRYAIVGSESAAGLSRGVGVHGIAARTHFPFGIAWVRHD